MSDDRFTLGLLVDVQKVLEAHGYRLPTDEQARYIALGRSMTALGKLVEAFEGRESA